MCWLQGKCVDGFGLPIDILVEEVVPETPFDPPRKDYISLVTLLQDKGLAIPSKRSVMDVLSFILYLYYVK